MDVLCGRQAADDLQYDDDNNRLLWYTVMPTAGAQNGFTLERVEYEYAIDGDAAGNVRRVVRKVADPPAAMPDEWDVFATEFFYNRAGEVQVISQRTWHQVDELEGPVITNLATTSIKEFRGNGRTRYMMRDRIINPGQPDDLMPDHDTGTWTSYDGDLPTQDLTLNWVANPPPPAIPHYEAEPPIRYHLGLAQFTPGAAIGEFDVKYFHPDHLGTTRAMTDEGETGPPAVPPAASPRIVYTAFGEQVSVNGTAGAPSPADTRYQYVGQHGYETFADFPYQHVGHRWYDPSTGRFLQRDPIGITGGMNTYAYAASSPVLESDPSGLDRYYERVPGHSYWYLDNPDGPGYYRYEFGPGSSNWVVGPGWVSKGSYVPSLSKAASKSRKKSTLEQDRADMEEMRRQNIAPPMYDFFGGGGGYNCITWAKYWWLKHEPTIPFNPDPNTTAPDRLKRS